MTSLANHLVRRGVEGFQASLRDGAGAPKGQPQLSSWGLTVLVVTVLFFVFGQFAIQYTYAELIGTLAAVEAPSSTAIIRTAPAESEESDHPDAPLLSIDEKAGVKEQQDQEILLIKQRALTSRFCTIRRHLKSRGGRASRFRGLGIYVMNCVVLSMITGFFTGCFHSRSTIFQILAITMMTPLELLWNHVVISEPSQKSWFQRIPSRSVVRKAFLPTFLYASITHITAQVFLYSTLTLTLKSKVLDLSSSMSTNHPLRQLFLVLAILLNLVLFIAIQIPIEIAIIRVRASLLSADEEPIIPFDRTFNGQVVSVEEGGKGMLNLWTAWVGCDMQTRLRVVGVYAKVVAMQLVWVVFGVFVLYGELRLIFGVDFVNKLSVLEHRIF